MSFDDTTRNALARLVRDCRRLLAGDPLDPAANGDLGQQLQSIYGLQPDGAQPLPITSLTHLDDRGREIAIELCAWLDHAASSESGTEPERRRIAFKRIVRETSFTTLNRLAALRMCEERKLVGECVRAGLRSSYFTLFKDVEGSALGDEGDAYRFFLELIFDELAVDLPALFDRYARHSLVFPSHSCLLAVLDRLNAPELARLWSEDETIGWMYQYFNPKEEREALRDPKRGGSAAPRNSRELAVRNQFFTPRYVVEFLTDNTLGRLWWEMTKGRTQLGEMCRYLVRRPNEVFLGNPAIIEVLDSAVPWVRDVILTADFSRLPEDPALNELSDLGLAIDGYRELERRKRTLENFQETYMDPQTAASTATGEQWTGDAFELWCALFLYQRGALRNGCFGAEDRASGNVILCGLWPALRRALQTPPGDLTQEEMLRLPHFIPHRPIKDPREIRLLDPACGSMHFGLYAFDLLEVIYDEAYQAHADFGTAALGDRPDVETLRSVALNAEAFTCEIPRLIIEHNIHGIDIDPRAVQIAGLSLWLRAQRKWSDLGLRAVERPRIRRSNLVCAEPMPGEPELLREFVEREFPAREREVFSRLLSQIFQKMLLAGEAGALLRIEEEIRSSVEQERVAHQGGELDFEGARLTSDAFWRQLESRIYPALQAYAEQVENVGAYQRRLFAEDAARGFAFIHLCQQRYDVALMNPPFGAASLPSKSYIEETYGDTKGDIYKAFVECFHDRLLPSGFLGIISSRTGFFLGQSEDWRARVVLRLFRPIVLADLGSGVLDAMVEVAAYVLRNLSVQEACDLTRSSVPVLEKMVLDKQDRFSLAKWQAARGGLKRHQAVDELERLEAHGFIERTPGDAIRYTPFWHLVKKVTAPSGAAFPPLVCIRALADTDKGNAIFAGVSGDAKGNVFVCDPKLFHKIPSTPFAYWVGKKVIALFGSLPTIQAEGRDAVIGASTKDDFRYLRLGWEIDRRLVARTRAETTDGRIWVALAKGGTFSQFYSDPYLVLQWKDDGREIKAAISEYRGSRGWGYQWTASLNGHDFYFRPALTWPSRTNGLSFRVLPMGCISGAKGPCIFVEGDDSATLLALNALVSSLAFRGLVGLQLARVDLAQSFEAGVIQGSPVPHTSPADDVQLAHFSSRAWREKRGIDVASSTSNVFALPALLTVSGSTLAERTSTWVARVRASEETVAAIQAEIDDFAFRLYDLEASDRAALTSTLTTEATSDAEPDAGEDEEEEEAAATADTPALTADLIAYALGCVFGRWDVRYATSAKSAAEPSDPFDPLPVCSPGMLQNAAGLPATAADVPADYPLRITWQGILVDDDTRPADDVFRRVFEALEVLWPDQAYAIAEEARSLLRVPSLREYFHRPGGFFAEHLKHHTKSRRQAPIYWPLSSAKGNYTLWLYYPRLTDQTLHTALECFVRPRLEAARTALEEAERNLAFPPPDARLADLRDTRERAAAFRDELQEFHDDLRRVATLPWIPDLNDGVLITACPLWSLFRYAPWRADLQKCWEELRGGKYDWAHLAFTLREAEVRAKCRTDRSLAIAHGLEAECEIAAPVPSRTRRTRETPSV